MSGEDVSVVWARVRIGVGTIAAAAAATTTTTTTTAAAAAALSTTFDNY